MIQWTSQHTDTVRLPSLQEIEQAAQLVYRDFQATPQYRWAIHELAHLREKSHDKAFYQLCTHMAPDYHQLEFDLRLYLTHLDAGQG